MAEEHVENDQKSSKFVAATRAFDTSKIRKSIGKNDNVSIFSGIKRYPTGTTDWLTVMENVRSDRYKDRIESLRLLLNDPVAYRESKTKLPSITFSGTFSPHREKENVETATGFLIPDLDHLPDVEEVFKLVSQDANIWFVFRSPSGKGLKCSLRSNGISTDADIKKFFAAAERYFSEKYGLKLDPSCKDISRLTFVSYDPDLFINESPCFFDVEKWQPVSNETYIPPNTTGDVWKLRYGKKVLDSCCMEISQSAPGAQHEARIKNARLVGGYIASGFIYETAALAAFERAVGESGAKHLPSAMKTISDAIENGKKEPIHVEQRQNGGKDIRYSFDDIGDIGDKRGHLKTIEDALKTIEDTKKGGKTTVNLTAVIREWISNSTGFFTSEQIDRDLVLTTRFEKKQRSQILSRFAEKKIVKKDMRGAGKFNIINSHLDEINIDDIDEESFDLILPFNLDRYTSIPKKSIIVLAGSSNAGKTALILNILKLNLSQQYKRLYLMSEMGPGEYVDRLRKFKDVPFSSWKSITSAERTCAFDGAIEGHNPDGLTCVDFLEDVGGDFFKIPSDIRAIYDSLGDGVVIIAIQKKTDSDYARGGQGTAEKSRLYMAVDLITSLDHSIICSLKIVKNKRYVNRNLQGHEIHFRIQGGAQIEAVSSWLKSTDVDRIKYRVKYEQENVSSHTKIKI